MKYKGPTKDISVIAMISVKPPETGPVRWGKVNSLYALATWFKVTSTSFWISIPRYMLTLFPIFIILAILGRRKEIKYLIIFLSLIFYALFLSLLVRFKWAF